MPSSLPNPSESPNPEHTHCDISVVPLNREELGQLELKHLPPPPQPATATSLAQRMAAVLARQAEELTQDLRDRSQAYLVKWNGSENPMGLKISLEHGKQMTVVKIDFGLTVSCEGNDERILPFKRLPAYAEGSQHQHALIYWMPSEETVSFEGADLFD